MTKAKLTLYDALGYLRQKDARMVMTSINGDRHEYWIWPACVRVEPKVAEQIKVHRQVMAGKDGIWPGHDQTWRMGGE